MMNFESLANELLLDLFEYLNGVHLFRAFYRLNIRLNSLLLEYIRFHGFDFRSASKIDFDIICQEYLPPITNQITSLYLSDDDETPQQLTCFLSYSLTLRQFTRLKSLSLTHIRSNMTMNTMMQELKHLPHLTHLTIIDCCFQGGCFQIIWRQPKLNDFKLQKIYQINLLLRSVSLSIRTINILATFNQLASLESLLKCTPHLRYFTVSLAIYAEFTPLSFIASSMKTLNLSYSSSFDRLEDILQRFPNLKQLTIRTKYIQLNGYKWETIIKDYLLKLISFQMLMEFDTNSNIESEKQVDEILDSFQTPFWLVERQWFVRCHWDPLHKNKNYCLYTLPCTFEQYIRYVTAPFKSTCPDISDQYLPNLTIYSLSAQLSNVHHLDLTLPCSDPFWLVPTDLPRLTSISVQVLDDLSAQSQLQSLLDRTSHLCSIRLYSKQSDCYILLAEITNKSIRRLDLRSIYLYYNKETCTKLCNTLLGNQCEVLLIQVEKRTDILFLINNMKNLRALYIHSRDCVQQSSNLYNPLICVDDLMIWLQEHLPTTFTIACDEYFPACVRLWIRY